MVSLYKKDGKEKPLSQYRAEVWAHDLTPNFLLLHIQVQNHKQSKEERKALFKEFKERKGICYSEWDKKNR